ncbi:MAG: TrbI F-type domain-containing protein [Gammaproteobacteria bacterium]|nr:TrbI F-type domain-containing protein [Gammaproteobacteria bacterium]
MMKIILISVLTNLVVTNIFFVIFHSSQEPAREVVTIDILKIMDDYSALAVNTMHDPNNMKKSAHALSQRLEEVIAINAKERHLVIMPKQAVIQGAQDITTQIEALVFGKAEAKK